MNPQNIQPNAPNPQPINPPNPPTGTNQQPFTPIDQQPPQSGYQPVPNQYPMAPIMPAKSNKLPLIIGLSVGGVVLLGAIVVVIVLFSTKNISRPTADLPTSIDSQNVIDNGGYSDIPGIKTQAEADIIHKESKLVSDNYDKITIGMTRQEVEQIIGVPHNGYSNDGDVSSAGYGYQPSFTFTYDKGILALKSKY